MCVACVYDWSYRNPSFAGIVQTYSPILAKAVSDDKVHATEWPAGQPVSYMLTQPNVQLIKCVRQAFLPPGTSPPDTVEEAQCLLSLAHAERDLQHAEKRLADVRVKQCKLRVRMYSLQAKKAAKRLGEAELEVGRVSLDIRRRHLVVHPTATKALRRYGRDIGRCWVF